MHGLFIDIHLHMKVLFNPERFVESGIDVRGTNFQLLTFGCGQRMCVGLPLGLTIFQLALARLLHGFTWKLPIGENPQKLTWVRCLVQLLQKLFRYKQLALLNFIFMFTMWLSNSTSNK